MGGTREQGVETETEVDVEIEVVVSATVKAPDHESFVEQMEHAARGEEGAYPADDPDLSGEDRFDAG
ncbi:hypothetical protein Xcel_2801 [Xylanimonas cellulosilytica DSM 15894]|uniref:Uncharacterized protein n=1 Tax=Xylanimonas cellulosilytica (strain DSM 15894 / JCM 12276 / CECT 5975 / KCTC 9989 / LMG 20990 / NBRC 107835 / XIL07) TaxID=446471 RepID=D1BYE3_XYLCX|nr:hypothetical protein [Xylanimonas cellulosilytica]ACZ31815.1 hypothetical protein Xcel_2801 [Xylanimonas cellulosilytica DSM 15894]